MIDQGERQCHLERTTWRTHPVRQYGQELKNQKGANTVMALLFIGLQIANGR